MKYTRKLWQVRDRCFYSRLNVPGANDTSDYEKEDINETSKDVYLNGKPSAMTDLQMRKPLYGLCPPDTRSGDVICILFGCSVPVILRPYLVQNGDTEFELIGESYVHGKMNGEAISGIEDSSDLLKDAQIFRIR